MNNSKRLKDEILKAINKNGQNRRQLFTQRNIASSLFTPYLILDKSIQPYIIQQEKGFQKLHSYIINQLLFIVFFFRKKKKSYVIEENEKFLSHGLFFFSSQKKASNESSMFFFSSFVFVCCKYKKKWE